MTGSADIGSADFDGLLDHMGSADFDSLFAHMEGAKQKKGKKGEKKDDEKKKGGKKKKDEDSGIAPPTLLGLQSMTGSADIGSADFDGLLDHMGSADFDDKKKKGKDDKKKKDGKKKGEDSGSAPPTLLGLQSMTGSADIGSADFDGLLDH